MDSVKYLSEYSADLNSRIQKTDFSKLGEIADLIISAHRKNKIYTVGNGGSAATASHICNDLLKGCAVGGNPGFDAECLADSSAIITCLANDFDYESIFSIPLATKAVSGDILIAFSGSGNSKNVLNAAVKARELGMTVIGFSGRDGGKLSALCDIILIAPSDNMEQIEDLHMMYVHALSCCIQKQLSK
ncbi:MAG: SIS domain-containing protein [Clostridia bacterium]|nr:SIS domain-containing protein [Clostridia bacterium]